MHQEHFSKTCLAKNINSIAPFLLSAHLYPPNFSYEKLLCLCEKRVQITHVNLYSFFVKRVLLKFATLM